jgi:hypothetical protein
MKDLGMKSFYRHDLKIKRKKKDREVKTKKQYKLKIKSKAQRGSKDDTLNP